MTAQPAESLAVPPAYLHRPPRARSMAPQLAALSAKLGRPLDAEQYEALDVLTGLRADGRPASLGAAVICPRQNMKSWCFELIALGRLLQPGGDKLIVWSAHEVSTSQNNFRDLQELIATHKWLDARVTKVSQANGKEGIQFAGNRWLRFKARIKTGGRGLSGDCVILDEAFALEDLHMGALLPILSTRPRAAVFYGSSAGLPESDILRSVRDRGRAGGEDAPAYVEWCAPGDFTETGCPAGAKCLHAPGTRGCALDREDYWLMANPAAAPGRRITLDYLRNERQELPPREFARERLGWWDDPATASPISVQAWLARVDEQSRASGRRVVALDIAPDRKSAAIGGAARRPDGAVHAALVDHRAGLSWVVPRLLELVDRGDVAAVVVDDGAPAGVLLPALKDAGLTVRSEADPSGLLVVMGTRDVGRSCGLMQDGVSGDAPWIWHRGDPIVTRALAGAARREIGDGGWAWGRKRSDVDISALVAMTEAVWGIATLPDTSVSIFMGDDDEDEAARDPALPPAPVGWAQFSDEVDEYRRQIDGVDDTEQADAKDGGDVLWLE